MYLQCQQVAWNPQQQSNGTWPRRRVEFDVHGRPELVNVVHLVRAPDGSLRKSETIGWRYKKPVDSVNLLK